MKEAKRGCRPSSGGHLDLPLAAQMKLQPWARPLASPRRAAPPRSAVPHVGRMHAVSGSWFLSCRFRRGKYFAAERYFAAESSKARRRRPTGGAFEDNLHAKWCTKLPYEATQLSHRVGPYNVTLSLAS